MRSQGYMTDWKTNILPRPHRKKVKKNVSFTEQVIQDMRATEFIGKPLLPSAAAEKFQSIFVAFILFYCQCAECRDEKDGIPNRQHAISKPKLNMYWPLRRLAFPGTVPGLAGAAAQPRKCSSPWRSTARLAPRHAASCLQEAWSPLPTSFPVAVPPRRLGSWPDTFGNGKSMYVKWQQ